MMEHIQKSLQLICFAIVLVNCADDNDLKCLPSEEEYIHFTKVYFTGNNIDSLDWWSDGKVCGSYELPIPRTPLDVYEVSLSESTDCSCIFINDVQPAYCEVEYEVIPGAYNLDNHRWDILYVFEGETIYHPPCGYMDFLAAYRSAGQINTEGDFVIAGTIGGNGYVNFFKDLDRDSQTMEYVGWGGFQAEGQANGAAYTRNIGSVFWVGDRISHYYFDNNLMYLINADSTGGIVFQVQEVL